MPRDFLFGELAVEPEQEDRANCAHDQFHDEAAAADSDEAAEKSADDGSEDSDRDGDENADEAFAVAGVFPGHKVFSEESDDEAEKDGVEHGGVNLSFGGSLLNETRNPKDNPWTIS